MRRRTAASGRFHAVASIGSAGRVVKPDICRAPEAAGVISGVGMEKSFRIGGQMTTGACSRSPGWQVSRVWMASW